MLKDEQHKVTRYVIDDLILDVKRYELTRNNKVVPLPKLSFDLLVCLAQSAPALVTPNEIITQVWQGRVIGDETLKQRVKLLRKALGDNAISPQYIEVVRGQGYRLVPEVQAECIVKQPPSVMLDLSANDHFPSITGIQQNKWWRGASLFAFVLLLMLLFSITVSPWIMTPTLSKEPLTAAANFADISANAVKKYQMGIDYYHRYRHTDNDIAIEVFNEAIVIEPEFSAAYAALSRAYSQRFYQFSGTVQDRQFAIDNAYLALAFNNQSANAYKALGTAYFVSGWLTKSINAHLRAFERDDQDVETATNLAFIYSQQANFTAALFWHQQALTLQPESAVAQLHFAMTLHRIGELDDAEKWYELALSLKPDYTLAIKQLADLYIEKGNIKRAKDYIHQHLARYKGHPMLSDILVKIFLAEGHYERANKLVQQLLVDHVKSEDSVNMQLSIMRNKPKVLQVFIENLQSTLKVKQSQGNEHGNVSFLLGQIALFQQDDKQMIRYWVQALEQGMIEFSCYQRALSVANVEMPREIQSKFSLIEQKLVNVRQAYQNQKSRFKMRL